MTKSVLGVAARLGPACALILTGCVVSAPVPTGGSQIRTGEFNHMYYKNTTGKVGYHMVSEHIVQDWDTPTGNSDTCYPASHHSSWTVTGTLPPGLSLEPGTGNIEGTPRQAGDWTASINISDIKCMQGPDQNDKGPRTVRVDFHINP